MRTFPGLTKGQRESIGDGLVRVLADTYTLYFKTHAFHWNVEGARFYGLHTLFETQYKEMWAAVDTIAERIRALGHRAPGSYGQLARMSSLREQALVPHAEDMIRELAEGHEIVVSTLRAVISIAADARDEATVGMLATRLEAHEKAAWMLSSLVETTLGQGASPHPPPDRLSEGAAAQSNQPSGGFDVVDQAGMESFPAQRRTLLDAIAEGAPRLPGAARWRRRRLQVPPASSRRSARSIHCAVSFSCAPFCSSRSCSAGKSTRSSAWSWLKQENTTLRSPRRRVDVRLQALRADFLHHALHRRVDRPDRGVARLQVRRQHAVPRRADRLHHAVRADDDQVLRVRQRHRRRAQPAGAVGRHRLHDVADEAAVLRPVGVGGEAGRLVAAPDDDVGGALDLRHLVAVAHRACSRRSRSPSTRPRAAPRRSRTAPRCRARRRPAPRCCRHGSRSACRSGPSAPPARPASAARRGRNCRPSPAR